MKATIFDNLETLNKYLEHRKRKDIEIKFQSQVVGQNSIGDKTSLVVNDRFLVLEE